MNRLKISIFNSQVWFSVILLAAGLMIISWAKTYPILYSQEVMPILKAASSGFWIGLCLGFIGLIGLSFSSSSKIVKWLCCVIVVILLSAPHFLYIAWGSDAGGLANMSAYVRRMGGFNFERDLTAITYYQWPMSIFFNQFLADLFNVDENTAAAVNFFLVSIAVSSGLFMLWQSRIDDDPEKQNPVFWGIVVYFAGFFWFLNWQSSPYAFALILFVPALALLEQNSWKERLLLLLFVVIGYESHALFGVWLSMIVGAYVLISILANKKDSRVSDALALFVVIAQVTIIIYKNTRFFRYLALNLKGYYDALLQTGASDRALAIQASGALSATSQVTDTLGIVLKTLSFIDLGFIGVALLVAVILAITRKRPKALEISLLLAGAFHFLIGIKYVAIGTRSIQLIALAPAFFVVESIVQGGKAGRLVLAASVVGLLLFPAAIMRSHQNSGNYVKPVDLYLSSFMNQFTDEILNKGNVIFTDGVRPIDLRLVKYVLSPRTIIAENSCAGGYFIIDSDKLRNEVNNLVENDNKPGFELFIEDENPSVYYDSGYLSLKFAKDCNQLFSYFHR